MLRFLSFFMLSIVLVECSTTNYDQERYVIHIVLIWLKEPGNEQHIKRIVDQSKNLKQISEIRQLRVGKSIPSNRKIVDDSFDVGIYMTFDSMEDMQRYLQHPIHKMAVKTVIKPLSERLLVYDIAEK